MDVQEKVEKDENYLVFSKFEAEDETFKSTAKNVCSLYNDKGKTGLPIRYCFKQLYNIQEGDGNQVHTRSLHAEENAFLQLAKYGSQGIDGGFLFTTASCCELCSKKAYQLGIKTIYYIDPYPGISANHILSVGVNKPVMKLFSGIVGTAYIKLYSQFIPIKDEIAAFYNVSKNDLKEAIKGGDKPKEELKKNNYDKDQPK
jgi:dCMP deaminase